MGTIEDTEHLHLLNEWVDDEGYELNDEGYYDWPQPAEYAEYRVTGRMRIDVLTRAGRDPDDDTLDVRLTAGIIEGGYSESTIEHSYPIEVRIFDGSPYDPGLKVFDHDGYWNGEGLPAFLRWLEESDR
jgi:hypothetical protein